MEAFTLFIHLLLLIQLQKQENGFVTITYPDGTKEKYNPQGQKVHIIKKEEVKYFFFFFDKIFLK